MMLFDIFCRINLQNNAAGAGMWADVALQTLFCTAVDKPINTKKRSKQGSTFLQPYIMASLKMSMLDI